MLIKNMYPLYQTDKNKFEIILIFSTARNSEPEWGKFRTTRGTINEKWGN